MRGPEIYYFAKDQLKYYASTTEPNLYPDAFEEMVKKSEYDNLVNALEALTIEYDEVTADLKAARIENIILPIR